MTTALYRVVHLSDLHFWRIPLNPLQWYGKRLLGLSNLILRRGRKFRQERFPELLEALKKDQPDHLIISGDLSTTSLDSEFAAFTEVFADWLRDPSRTTLVPGNHDRYTRGVARKKVFERYFSPFCGEGQVPFLKNLTHGLDLIGFDPCCPNPFSARGRIEEEMLINLNQLVRVVRESPLQCRCLLFVCHYPAEVPPEHEAHQRGHDLIGAHRLLEVLQQVQIPIYWLHGHIHYPWVFQSPTHQSLSYLNPGAPILRRAAGISLGRWILTWDGKQLQTEWRSQLGNKKEAVPAPRAASRGLTEG
jgi:3',5'-cyclic AMP phosphodiesterase CpdA